MCYEGKREKGEGVINSGRFMRLRFYIIMALLFGMSQGAWAVTYYFGVDVPATLSSTDYLPNQIVKSIDAVYSVEVTLPMGTELSALHLRSDGVWLFTPAFPLNLGGTDYEPRDIVAYNGTTYSLFLDGNAVGISEDARIDSLFLDAGGHPILSFDVPVNISSTEYSQNDLVLYNSGFSLYWNGQTAGVPADANIVGAAVDNGGILVFSFDVPTNISSIEYLPGQLVQWSSGGGFSSYFVDSAWPSSAQVRDISFQPQSGAGAVPDGRFVPGTPLRASKAGATGNITLTWSASCITSDNDYEIYEGAIGNYTSHAQKYCSTSGATTMTFTPATSSAYYLVVPRNASSEGSYGYNSSGSQRPPASSPCRIQLIIACP